MRHTLFKNQLRFTTKPYSLAFGYTSESFGDSTQLLYLRARHYAPGIGRFLSRDRWMGDYSRPLSLNPWLYVEGDPVNRIDPTGRTPMQAGYVEGFSIAAGVGEGTIDGREIVYDYATMTRARFTYDGKVGGLFGSIGATAYLGKIIGFHYGPKPLPIGLNSFPDLPRFKNIIDDYSDDFDGWYAGGSPIRNVTGGIGAFHSPDGSIKGSFSYLSLGIGIGPELIGFHTFYKVDPGSLPGYENTGVEYYYDTKTRRVNTGKLISDILTGDHSPLAGDIPLLGGVLADSTAWVGASRTGEVVRVIIAANRFEKYYYQPQYGQCIDGYPLPPGLPDQLTNPFPIPTMPGVP